MQLKTLGILILVLHNVHSGLKNLTEVMSLVHDLIEKQNVPSIVTAYLCWTGESKMDFLRHLSTRNIPTKISGFNNTITIFSPSEYQIFLLDLDCLGSDNILKQAQDQNLFGDPFRWILWGKTNHSLFQDLFFGIDSRVYLIDEIDNGYHIKLLYKREENCKIFSENDIAKWNPFQGFIRYDEFSIAKTRTDLAGMNMNISFVITDPDTLNHLEDYRNKHIDPLTKLSWILVRHLMSFLNATSTNIFQPTWGYKNPNTSLFSGMMGDLQSGRAELGGTACFLTMDRIDVVEFFATSVPTYMKFIFKAPPLSYVTNVFTLPFDTHVWYSCFLLCILTFFVVFVIVKWEWKDMIFRQKLEQSNATSTMPLRPSFFSVVLMEIGAITQQGTDTEPKSNAGRIATIFTFIAFMFLYTSYSANIVALLQSTTESIRTLEDLLNYRISLGVHDIVYGHYYFETAEDPTRKAIYQQKIAPKGQKPNFMSLEKGISRVQKDFFGFHVETSIGYKVIGDTFQESEKCGLREVTFFKLNEPFFAMRKNTTFKEIFKVGMRKILESGLQRRESDRIYVKKPVCHSKGSNFGSAGLLDCYAAFLLFGIGLGCSMIFFIFELVLNKYNAKRNNRVEHVWKEDCCDTSLNKHLSGDPSEGHKFQEVFSSDLNALEDRHIICE
nr:uncharacterized protein LOC111510234 [Leptinotarsa decemlineata]